ncbi:hypothetical protein LMG32289_05485 [Cupriavidus pampae]|jgi:hypothetical protein|uniref:Heme exporter protein D n=1 Tax=Cupriavidus pampae TaxID=659251 RepID=A0ABN7ZEA2_9BURK|nr:hypothetical protein LMG32289_05485 [Cupriavidus pampae]
MSLPIFFVVVCLLVMLERGIRLVYALYRLRLTAKAMRQLEAEWRTRTPDRA